MKEGLAIIFVTGILGVLAITSVGNEVQQEAAVYSKGAIGELTVAEPISQNTIVFGGDVLLARDVEQILDRFGSHYAFSRLSDVFSPARAVVVNFEATIPETHVPTPELTTNFSVDSEHIPALYQAGVTHVSLANNHSMDKGEAGLLHTIKTLKQEHIQPFGIVSTSSLDEFTVIGTEHGNVAIVGIDAVSKTIDRAELQTTLKAANRYGTVQVAFIHWGNEYEAQHSVAQQELAYWLIDNGIDLIVGHHPHVVQDIEQYRQKLIIYSLGNLVFDQYFDDEVQEGLLVSLASIESGYSLEFLPTTSLISRGVPQLLTEREREIWLRALAARSDESLRSQIQVGVIELDELLAISP